MKPATSPQSTAPPRRGAKGGSAHRGRSSATAYRRERSYGVGDGLRTVFANTQASAETHAHAGTPAQRGSRGGRVPRQGGAYTPSGSHRKIQSGCWPVSHALRGSGGARGRMGLRSTVQTAVGQSPLSLTRRMAHRLRAKVLIHGTDLGALCPLENRQPDMWIATRRIRTRGGSKGEGLIWLPRRFRNHPTSVFLNTIYRRCGRSSPPPPA